MTYLEPHYTAVPLMCCLISDIDGEQADPEVWTAFIEYCHAVTDEGRAYDAALRRRPWPLQFSAQQLRLLEAA